MNDMVREVISKLLGKNLILVWVLFWILPWTLWIESWPWIRLGISILILIMPGFVLSLLLANKRLTLLAHFTSALAISTFIVGFLGLLSRIFHFPFTLIKITFMLFGLVCLWLLGKDSF